MKNKLYLRIFLNSALGVILIFIWSRFVDLPTLLGHLKNTDPKWGGLFFIFFCLSGTLRGFRLKVLLGKYQLSLQNAVMLTFLSQFLSFLIPVRAGEITKSVYLAGRFDISVAKTVVWVFIDRYVDFLGIMATIFIFALFVPTNLPPTFYIVILGILTAFGIFFALAVKTEEFLKKTLQIVSNCLVFSAIKKRFVTFTYSIVEGFEILRRNLLELLFLIVITMVTLVSDGLLWLIAFAAIGENIGLSRSILGNGLTALTFLIPAAPGYVGSAEAAGLAVFSGALKMNPNLASAGTVLFHLLTMVAVLIVGIGSLYFLKFDLGSVWKKIKIKGD